LSPLAGALQLSIKVVLHWRCKGEVYDAVRTKPFSNIGSTVVSYAHTRKSIYKWYKSFELHLRFFLPLWSRVPRFAGALPCSTDGRKQCDMATRRGPSQQSHGCDEVKEITKETNPSDNNKIQATEIRKGTNSSLKSIKSKVLRVY
jgi:hypothetical protein